MPTLGKPGHTGGLTTTLADRFDAQLNQPSNSNAARATLHFLALAVAAEAFFDARRVTKACMEAA